jgi:hypothetical protein
MRHLSSSIAPVRNMFDLYYDNDYEGSHILGEELVLVVVLIMCLGFFSNKYEG